jgi:hypothetical protein
MNLLITNKDSLQYMRNAALLCLFLLFVGFNFLEKKNDIEFIGYVKSKRSTEIQNSPWGIQAGTLDKDVFLKAIDIGVKWTRLQANWSDIERQNGIYDWEETDIAFSSGIDNSITPFVTICGTNALYVTEKRQIDSKLAEIYGTRLLPPTSNPKAMQAWLKFVRSLVERYKTKIKYWEIWNEPNHFAYWGDEPDGKEYGRLVYETASAIDEIDPQAEIIAGATASLDPEFTEAFLSAGNAKLIDIITFHNYGAIPEERIYKAMEVWDVINKYNSRIKLWQGECGYPSHSSTRDYRGLSPWGLNIQAKWLLRQSFTDTYFCRASLSNYFKLFHDGGRGKMPKRSFLTGIDSILGFPERNGSRVKVVGVNEKCLLENPSLKPKPGYFAYQNLCSVMDSRYIPYEIKNKISIIDAGIFYGIGLEDDAFPSIPLVASYKTNKGNLFIAYWLPWHPQEIINTARIDLTLVNADFKNPVLVDLLEGKVYKLNECSKNENDFVLLNIPLADYPFVIVEKDEIEIVDKKEMMN